MGRPNQELRSGRQFAGNVERTAEMYSCRRLYRKALGWEKWLKKPDETANFNNRSLALRLTERKTKSGWEHSDEVCSHSCFWPIQFFYQFSAVNLLLLCPLNISQIAMNPA